MIIKTDVTLSFRLPEDEKILSGFISTNDMTKWKVCSVAENMVTLTHTEIGTSSKER